MCQQVEHLKKLVGIHFKLYKSKLSVWRESALFELYQVKSTLYL